MEASAKNANRVNGRTGETVEVCHSNTHDTPEVMTASLVEARGEGFRRFQPRIGGEPDPDIARVHAMVAERAPEDMIVFDAIGKWLSNRARRFSIPLPDGDVAVMAAARGWARSSSRALS